MLLNYRSSSHIPTRRSNLKALTESNSCIQIEVKSYCIRSNPLCDEVKSFRSGQILLQARSNPQRGEVKSYCTRSNSSKRAAELRLKSASAKGLKIPFCAPRVKSYKVKSRAPMHARVLKSHTVHKGLKIPHGAKQVKSSMVKSCAPAALRRDVSCSEERTFSTLFSRSGSCPAFSSCSAPSRPVQPLHPVQPSRWSQPPSQPPSQPLIKPNRCQTPGS